MGNRALQLAVVLLPIVAFAPGLTSPLTRYDDGIYLDRPEMTEGVAGLASLWKGERAWRGEFIEYFPLRDSVYWLVWQQWERLPVAYHLTSLVFHLLATLLVLRLLLQLGQSSWVAWAATLLFAVHPIHIESVIWAAGLKDPMYTCLVLGSLLAYARYRLVQRPMLYALALGLLTGALLVKSMAISTPLLMLAIERLIGTRTSWKTVFARLAAPAAISAIFLVQFIAIGRLNGITSEPHGESWSAHLVLTVWAQVVYVRQALFPASFRLIYCFAPVESLADARLLAGIALFGAIGVAVFVWRKVANRLFCLSFYFACLLPVSNLVPFPAVVADRYLYAASIGSCLLIALLLDATLGRLKPAVLVLLVGGLTVTTALRSAIWHDEEALWQEGDEDPVCLVDPGFPAGQVHFLRYKSAKDDETRLAAIARGIESRGMRYDYLGLGCEALIQGASLAATMGDRPRAEQWATRAARTCNWNHPTLWVTVLQVTAHRDLPLAATAAERVYRLLPSPRTNLFRVLTRIEAHPEGPERQELAAIIRDAPAVTCPVLHSWAREVAPALATSVHEALALCGPDGK